LRRRRRYTKDRRGYFACRLLAQRPDTQVGQPDIGHPVSRAIGAARDHVAADQPLILHFDQIFKSIAMRAEMLDMIIAYGQDLFF
jgi:hypothetical protein